jgi:putative endonuclease
MFYAYILKSFKDGRYYYGSSEDLEKRIAKHNNGQVKAT